MKQALIKLHISVFLAGFTGVLGVLILLAPGVLVWYRIMLTVVTLFVWLSWKNKIAKIQTKVNSGKGNNNKTIVIKVPKSQVQIKQITIDDISSFDKVKKVKIVNSALANMPEAKFKKGILKILKETGPTPKDWGGEKNDVFTNKIMMGGKRFHAALALKGPGKKINKITSKHMGKNGDQIQRLFDTPASIFMVQYEGEVKESVYKLMEELSKARAVTGGEIFWGVIDDDATKRLRKAYPKAFPA